MCPELSLQGPPTPIMVQLRAAVEGKTISCFLLRDEIFYTNGASFQAGGQLFFDPVWRFLRLYWPFSVADVRQRLSTFVA